MHADSQHVLSLDDEITYYWNIYHPDVSTTTIKKIIECESHGQQSARNYKAVVGVDVGLMQLNTYFHQKQAAQEGLDIYTEAGNLTYGFELMKAQGSKPWYWSKGCWSK